MNAYKFHSNYGSHTKVFAADHDAFVYDSELRRRRCLSSDSQAERT